MANPTRRTECGAGVIRSEIAAGRLLRLVDSHLGIVHQAWRDYARMRGIQAKRYWLFVHPQGGEIITGKDWRINDPPGSPPTWIYEGFDDYDAADDRCVALAKKMGLALKARLAYVSDTKAIAKSEV